jgi:dipeptidyl aminopeptidase/acylaminoacyl peptidase
MLKSSPTPKRLLAALVIGGLAACDDSVTSPPPGSEAFVAVTTTEASKPALFVQRLSGTDRERIHFTHVTDSVPGNLASLEVTDENLIALGSPSWDPSGSGRLAVVVTLANDQSELVVMSSDTAGKVASPNMQIITSDPQWSPDGRKLAYTMSTKPLATFPDLFVTDLTTNTVTRLTTGANILSASIRWSSDGNSIYYAHTTGSATSGPDNRLSQVVKIDAASRAADTLQSGIVGQISAISRSGDEVLLTRNMDTTSTPARALIALPLGGTESVLVDANASYAHFVAGSDNLAIVVTASGTSGNVTYTYEVIDVSSKNRTPIGGVTGEADVDLLTVSLGID